MLPVFETERMRLRPFTKDDYHFMRLLDSDPKVVKYLGHGGVRTEEETRTNLDKILNDYSKHGLGLYLAEDKNSGELLGRTGIIPWKVDSQLMWEVGYSFKTNSWGRGYATEAAKFLVQWGLKNWNDHLISLIHPENKSSIHVAEKAGMQFWKIMMIENLTPQIKQLKVAVYRITK